MKIKKPKILFYDIETSPLRAWVWRLGKQVVRHIQLDDDYNKYGIICITYCWNDGKPAKAIDWGYKEQDSSKVVERFDKIIKQADITIGKNSDRFDVKHINTIRMMNNLSPMPEWVKYTDDLEKQMRKYFYLPSYGLDYFSDLLGFGGKIKMEFQDWIDIVEKTPGQGRQKLKKMVNYGKKDVEDTRALWNYVSKHFDHKFNMATYNQDMVCKHCGSSHIHKNGIRQSGQSMYQLFFCTEHGGYAGRAAIRKNNTLGSIS
jgi:hypothetical protein